jgi:hypothetical protein
MNGQVSVKASYFNRVLLCK